MNWQLPVAPAKCSVLKISRFNGRPQNNSVYHIGNHVLPVVSEIDDLGIVIDKQLSLSNHIHGVVGKAKQRIYLLFKCFISRHVSLIASKGLRFVCLTTI